MSMDGSFYQIADYYVFFLRILRRNFFELKLSF